ncbi:PREDICTED: histone-lysine N-methyltransferase SETDB1-B-like isoform X1 [Amphimedon queenslandica]|uniref:Histone-lysine N-methyltransferase n=1 Tax=Amphimedon queenslandica TaxID=400682 RepID=A0A1X7UPE3_AMPQE|nr:PREDICTED: histone-lysine N-methyltransferase SETDB1-B-like isoform X1 [Amphimedon queenslandica]|eukprot:XP_019852999.1 PREDICTED: histone-lysine N-methyltransferase SETDB1-B-like isoform X1 [Amphimedon queenslandica]
MTSVSPSPLKTLCQNVFSFFVEDISNGKETLQIPCLNWVDTRSVPPFNYVKDCCLDSGVSMETDNGFMIRCGCSDQCSLSHCSCRQLTEDEGQGLTRPNKSNITDGYDNSNRLMSKLVSGLYECNKYCQCSSSCGNRVIQNGIKHKLMVFKTKDIGWGVLTLEDIPQGSFVCSYVGLIMNDEIANRTGLDFGDNYLAELDYIEVLEYAKECDGGISGTSSSEGSLVLSSSSNSDSDTSNQISTTGSNMSCSPLLNEDNDLIDEDGHYLVSLSSNTPQSGLSSYSIPLTRSFFNESHSYVIDASSYGNVARFINHSCSPNLFVQNVFVDSHDIRFPSVAFFAQSLIPAYSQLFWDYNYIIGSVEGKAVKCMCGSSNCRGRLI